MSGMRAGAPRVSTRRVLGLVAALGCLAMASACGGRVASGSATSGDPLLVRRVPGEVVLSTRTVPGVGEIVTDASGQALYYFPPDARRAVTCTGPCAGSWPTLAVSTSGRVRAAGLARPALIGTDPDPTTGAWVVTYAGHPLYRYSGDVRPGQINGQGLFLDGGPWYLLDPAGAPVTAPAARRTQAALGSAGGGR